METRATTSPIVIDRERHTLLSPPRFDYGALQALSIADVTHARSGKARAPVAVGLDNTRKCRDEREDI